MLTATADIANEDNTAILFNTMTILHRFKGNALPSVSLPLHRPPGAKRRKRNDDGYFDVDDENSCCCNSIVIPMALDEDDTCTKDSTSVMELELSPQAFVETLLQVCTCIQVLQNPSQNEYCFGCLYLDI
jgi:hypothetical protein